MVTHQGDMAPLAEFSQIPDSHLANLKLQCSALYMTGFGCKPPPPHHHHQHYMPGTEKEEDVRKGDRKDKLECILCAHVVFKHWLTFVTIN